MRILLPFSLFLCYSPYTDSCVATSSNPGANPTVATTTTTTTTISTPPACAGCTLENPAIEHLMMNVGTRPLTSDTVTYNAATGCVIRTMTCEGNGPGSTVFLAWNRDMHGTTQGANGANFVSDTMICDGMNWVLTHEFYSVGPQAEPITSVECTST